MFLDGKEKAPPGGDRGGAFEDISLATKHPSIDTKIAQPQAEKRNPRAVEEVKRELLRESLHETCGFLRLHAEACQTLAEASDDAGLIHSLRRLILYAKEAARTGVELRDLRKEPP